MADQRRVKITIDGEGGYGIEALEGFSGTSCVEQTRNLELAIGGVEIQEGKKDSYYDGDDDNNIMIKL